MSDPKGASNESLASLNKPTASGGWRDSEWLCFKLLNTVAAPRTFNLNDHHIRRGLRPESLIAGCISLYPLKASDLLPPNV